MPENYCLTLTASHNAVLLSQSSLKI